MVRKAVIPAAGLGTRFLPASKAQPKEMIPVIDKPAIQYVVEEAVRAGLDDIIIVTGRGKGSIEDHFDYSFELERHLADRGKTDDLGDLRAIAELADVHFVRQGEPKGLGHAVSMARRHVGEEPFAVLLGDDLMDERAHVLTDLLAIIETRGAPAVALKRVGPEAISSYGCARVEAVAGEPGIVRIVEIVEKPAPEEAPSDLAVMGRYVFTPAIFDALDRITPGRGGELQLTDAIALLMEAGPVYGLPFTWGRFDTGNKLEYLKATVELALERPDLGPEFRAWLEAFLADPTSADGPPSANGPG